MTHPKTPEQVSIFLSHATPDRSIARALKELIEAMFPREYVHVEYSSDESQGEGIPPGDQWLPWITRRIKRADMAYILLTPNSTARPWVLWESGAAAGVALASRHHVRITPITFGISKEDIPPPLRGRQCVVGDSAHNGGIRRILQDINNSLGSPLIEPVFESTFGSQVRDYLSSVEAALQAVRVPEGLLTAIPPSFEATLLAGAWVTCFQFTSAQGSLCSADVVEVRRETPRGLRVTSRGWPPPRTEGHATPFVNEIVADLVGRHLIGTWKNTSDTRYFGGIHLAVQSVERKMRGHYTSYVNDVNVAAGPWTWARLAPTTTEGTVTAPPTLRHPTEIWELLEKRESDAPPLTLEDILEGS